MTTGIAGSILGSNYLPSNGGQVKVVPATAPLIIDGGSGPIPAFVAGTVFELAGLPGGATRENIDTWGGGAVLNFRRTNGTREAPTGLLADQVIGRVSGTGFSTSYNPTLQAAFEFFSAETWTATAQGTYAKLTVMTPGTILLQEVMRARATDILFGAPVRPPSYAVATLPAATAALLGAIAVVTDGLTPTYGAAAVGGGAVVTQVFCTGAGWTFH